MIDTFSILFSTVMIVAVLVRAVQLDRLLPWFEARPEDAAPARLAALAKPGTLRPGATRSGAPRGTAHPAAGRGADAGRGARPPSVGAGG